MIRSFVNNLRRLKLSAKLSYKYVKDLAMFPFKAYTYRSIYLGVSRAIDSIGNGYQKPESFERIVYIGQEEDIGAWEIDTDYRLGGNSKASIQMVDGYLRFSGSLLHYKELDYQEKLYSEAYSAMLVKKMYRDSNGIQIEVKTDGNSYALIQDKSQEWTVLQIPLNNLISHGNEHIITSTFDLAAANGIRINAIGIGIYSHDQKEGDFEICLRSVQVNFTQMIYKQEFEDLKDKYPYPIMFKSISDSFVDTGNGKLYFDKKVK